MDTANEVVTRLSSQFELSDADIAKRVGSSQPTIWRLRCGKTKDCTADLYRRLCQLRDTLSTKTDFCAVTPGQPEQEAA